MQIVLIILSLGLLGVIIYFVVSPKSSRLLRLVAIIALGLIALSLAICGIILIRGPSEDTEAVVPPFILESDSKPAEKSNVPMVITFLIVLVFIMALIVRTSINEKKKPVKPEKKEDKPKPVQKPSEDSAVNVDSAPGSDDDDLFNLDIK